MPSPTPTIPLLSDPALTASHMAGDPGFARAQRAHLRRQQQDQGALKDALRAQEGYDQPEEERNEAGDPIEPFHLRKELEEGAFDPAGNYIEYEREEEQDAWLDSIEDQVHGTGPDRGRHLPYANEPVAEPPPLKGREVLPFLRQLLGVLQHGETVPAALRRLAGAGPVLTKFGSKEEAQHFFEEQVRSGHAVPAGNWEEFRALTEAAEVLFDAGRTDVYTLKREALAHRLAEEQAAERAPPAAAPTAQAAAEAAAEFGAAGEGTAGRGGEEAPAGGSTQASPGRLLRHHDPPPAAPAAAAEPAAAPDQPSVPSGERTAATTRGGAGVQAAAHGFASQVPADVLAELLVPTAPPQGMEAGLGLPTSAPTAQELQAGQQLDVGGRGRVRRH
jgi:CD2 antigen cytoplasmic tail-binding protein 2